MIPIFEWFLRSYRLMLKDLPTFIGYYSMRDRLPFFALLSYLMNKNGNNWFSMLCSDTFLALIFSGIILTIYITLMRIPMKILLGFNWNSVYAIQYMFQIIYLAYIGFNKTKDRSYGWALGFNGAAATGYLYEIPFWIYSEKSDQVNLLHTNYRNIFFFNFQIIAIAIFPWLLKEQNIKFNLKDLLILIVMLVITIIFASKMYLWHTAPINRLPIIAYSIYLTNKLRSNKK